MKKCLMLLAVCGLVFSAAAANAGELDDVRVIKLGKDANLFQVSHTVYGPPPPAPGEGAAHVALKPIPAEAPQSIVLFDCVRYKDLRNVHPCAVPKIVAVQDPCYDARSCCGPKCVYVKICVPPCGCECIKVSRKGAKVTYDYGKYRVEITSRRGVVTVDYDD